MYNTVDPYTLAAWGYNLNDPFLQWMGEAGYGFNWGDEHPEFSNADSHYSLPDWVTRYRTGNGQNDLELARFVWERLNQPDSSGRKPWGDAGYPLVYEQPGFFNLLPYVVVDGKPWARIGEPLGRSRAWPEYAPVLKQVPTSLDNVWNAEYGYLAPTPVVIAMGKIATMRNTAANAATDKLFWVVFSAGLGATLGAALSAWASAGFDFSGIVGDVASSVIRNIPSTVISNIDSPGNIPSALINSGAGSLIQNAGGTMFDDVADWGGDWAGSDWELPSNYADWGDYGAIDSVGDYVDPFAVDGAQGAGNYGDFTPDPVTATPDPFEIDGAQAGGPGDGSGGQIYKTTADIEDAELGQAMAKAKAAGPDYWSKIQQYADKAGKIFKFVKGVNAQGQPTVRPVAVTLPNGQQAVKLPNGQIVSANSAAAQQYAASQSSLPSWALPAGLAALAFVVMS